MSRIDGNEQALPDLLAGPALLVAAVVAGLAASASLGAVRLAKVVDELDLSAIYAGYERKDGRGLAAYHPVMLTRVLLYAYCVGMTSSRRIEKATYEDVAVRFLAADQHPDHDTIAFRQEYLQPLAELFSQALRLCQRAGLVKLGNVALDGTKLRANASRERSVSSARLADQEKEWQATVTRLLEQAQQADRQEDERYGKGRSDDQIRPELADAETRLRKTREAKQALEQEAAEKLEAAQRDYPGGGRPRKDAPSSGLSQAERERRKKRLRRAKRNAKLPGRQYNFTDPDSRVMHDNGLGCFLQAYNAQAAVDGHAQVIVAADVTQEVVDRGRLLPMCERMRETLGVLPPVITADAGYWDSASIEDPSLRGVDLLVAPDAMHRWAKPKAGKPCGARAAELWPAAHALRHEAGHRRTSVRPNQRDPGPASLQSPQPTKSKSRVAVDLPHSQPAEVIPLPMGTATVRVTFPAHLFASLQGALRQQFLPTMPRRTQPKTPAGTKSDSVRSPREFSPTGS